MLTTRKQLLVAYITHKLINFLYRTTKIISLTLLGAIYVQIVTKLSEPSVGLAWIVYLMPIFFLVIIKTVKRLMEESESGKMKLDVFEPVWCFLIWTIFFVQTSHYTIEGLLDAATGAIFAFLISWVVYKCNKPLFDIIMKKSIIKPRDSWSKSYKTGNNDVLLRSIVNSEFHEDVVIVGSDGTSGVLRTETEQRVVIGLPTELLGTLEMCKVSFDRTQKQRAKVGRTYVIKTRPRKRGGSMSFGTAVVRPEIKVVQQTVDQLSNKKPKNVVKIDQQNQPSNKKQSQQTKKTKQTKNKKTKGRSSNKK